MLDFLFPNYTCLVCRGELNAPQNIYLCGKCAETLPINTEYAVLKDPAQKQHFYKAYAAFEYKEPVVDLILRLKYNAESAAAAALAPFMAALMLKHNLDGILIPVPLCKKRKKERGYNQAELLAREISKITNTKVVTDAIIRTKVTAAQKDMNIKERAANLKNAFEISNKEHIKGKQVILIDDVFTSGSTANECARVLKSAGAVNINVLTIAAVL